MACDDFFRQCLWSVYRVGIGYSGAKTFCDFFSEPEQSPCAQDLRCQWFAISDKIVEWYTLSGADTVDQAEVCGREKTQIIAILSVQSFEALGNDQLDAGVKFSLWAVLARRTLPYRLPPTITEKPPFRMLSVPIGCWPPVSKPT